MRAISSNANISYLLTFVSVLGCVQTDPTLLDVTCWVRLHTLLEVVAQSLKPVKLFSQQLLTFLLFLDRRSVAQQCWIRLHSSSNIVGAAHAHCACVFVMGCILPTMHCRSQHCWSSVASLCTPLTTCTQKPSCCVRLHAALGSFSVLQMNLITKWRFPKDWIDIVQYQHHFAALKGNQTSNSFHNTKTHLNWNFYFQLSTVVANSNFI